MTKIEEGRGISHVPKTSAEQDEIRRARKRKQRGARPSSDHFSFDEPDTAQHRRIPRPASEHEFVLSLPKGSTVRRLVDRAISYFPFVQTGTQDECVITDALKASAGHLRFVDKVQVDQEDLERAARVLLLVLHRAA